MKTITNATSDSKNKVNDTSAVLRFYLWNDGIPQNITGKYSVATIANAHGYLFDVPLKNDGYDVSLDFSDDNLKKLTADQYSFEIHVTNDDGNVEIYPTEGTESFTVLKNLDETSDDLIPIVTFDALLKSVDKKVSRYLETIAKGDPGVKGDTGANGMISNLIPITNLNDVVANVENYVGNWYVETDSTTGGTANGYPIDEYGKWILQITSFADGYGLIKANFNALNKNYIGAVNNGNLVSWVDIQSMEENNVFNSDITVNGNIKANSITSTSGGFTIKTDYMGDY